MILKISVPWSNTGSSGSGVAQVEVESGKEAINIAPQENPDLILMDLFMPEIDGAAAALQIRENNALRRVPIVATSAYGEGDQNPQQKSDTGEDLFDAYLPKPFGPDELRRVLERFLPGQPVATATPGR